MSRNRPRLKGRRRTTRDRRKELLAGSKEGPNFRPVASPRLPPSPPPDDPRPNPLQQGVDLLAIDELDLAQKCFCRAIEVDPRDAIAHNCLGIVLRRQGRTDEAMDCFQRALQVRPTYPEAENNLGNVLRDQGRFDEAASCYRRAIQQRPQFAEAHNNLGVILLGQRRATDAVASFQEALTIRPAYAEALNNLGNTWKELNDLDAAAESYRAALRLAPHPEIHNNIANVLREVGQLQAAEKHYRAALHQDPNSSDGNSNLATVLEDQGQYYQALQYCRRAVQLNPNSFDLLTNLANVHRQRGAVAEARATYRRVSELAPRDPWPRVCMSALCPVSFASRESMDAYRQKTLEQWRVLAESPPFTSLEEVGKVATEPSFQFQFLDGNLRPMREAYARIFSRSLVPGQCLPRTGPPRVGVFVSRKHEGIFLKSMRGIIERLDTAEFELVILCPRSMETRVRQHVERDPLAVMCVPERLDQAAEAVRSCGLDVLYYWEIGRDAATYFLPFLRLAPVQCTSWGIPVTSGIPQVDYYLSSQLVEPPDAAEHYSERLLLADTLLTYQYRPVACAGIPDRCEFGLRDDQHVYLCAQQIGKFHPDFDPLLARILRSDEKGVLVITDDRFRNGTRILGNRFRKSMPDVAERIHFVPHLQTEEYQKLIQVSDVLLDPLHFGSVNSTYDGLAQGKPIVTSPSAFHRGRYTAGCYRKMGLEELVARDSESYCATALEWGTHSDARNDVQRKIEAARSALFEDRHAVDEFKRLMCLLLKEARS